MWCCGKVKMFYSTQKSEEKESKKGRGIHRLGRASQHHPSPKFSQPRCGSPLFIWYSVTNIGGGGAHFVHEPREWETKRRAFSQQFQVMYGWMRQVWLGWVAPCPPPSPSPSRFSRLIVSRRRWCTGAESLRKSWAWWPYGLVRYIRPCNSCHPT